MSLSQNEHFSLVLGSIFYDAGNCTVVYRAIIGDESISLEASVSDTSGIRSLVMSDKLEQFLRPCCTDDPGIVKRLVRTTFRVVDGETLEYPIQV